nr:DUF2924 domain-containing protein [Mariprofundus sp. KV]
MMGLSRSELAYYWERTFGYAPPKRCGIDLLQAALAWQLQMEQLPKQSFAEANQIFRRIRKWKPPTFNLSLSPGTRLLREWQGKTHHVTVLEKGFEHDGEKYRSLSAIARKVTGTPWSGPKFFGLKP